MISLIMTDSLNHYSGGDLYAAPALLVLAMAVLPVSSAMFALIPHACTRDNVSGPIMAPAMSVSRHPHIDVAGSSVNAIGTVQGDSQGKCEFEIGRAHV